MKPFLALFLILATLGPPLEAAPLPLLIAAEDDAEPWSQRDGTGYANDVVLAAFQAAGVKAELEVLPYARCKDYVLRGKRVAGFSMSWLPEFKDQLVFSEKPLFRCYSDFFFPAGKAPKARRQEELPKGSVVGVVIGYEYPPALYALREQGVVVLEEAESEEINLKKLGLGRLDAAIIHHNETKPAELMLAKAGVLGKVKRGFRCGILGSHIGFGLRHPEGAWAKRKFDKGYARIAADGTLGRIDRRWEARARAQARIAAREAGHGAQ